MSDTRFPFQVPTPGDDGVPDADTGRSTDGQGRTPAPWPMPAHTQPSPASWPEPPDLRPGSGAGRREAHTPEEDSGEVTAWGYPAYQEPVSAAENDAWANWDTQAAPGQQEPSRDTRPPAEPQGRTRHRTPSPAEEADPRASHRGDPLSPPQPRSHRESSPTSPAHPGPPPPAVPQTWGSQRETSYPSSREARTPYPDARRDPLDLTRNTAPAGNLLDPLDPAWSPGQPGAQPPAARATAPSHRRGEPAEAPAPAERPFSYWENSRREPEPGPWNPSAKEQEPRPQEEPPPPPGKKKRDPYLDNVKFILIVLVATGHSLVPTLAAHSAKSAYLFIYTFHMPAFVLISGYLGRNFWHSNAKINKLVDTMLVPYAVVEIGYALLRYGLGQKWSLTIIDPAWLNWYLLALVLWRISTPIWTRMRQPLLVAVTIYLIAGFSEISGDFSIDRFFGLLPFYVLGLVLQPEHFDLLKALWVKILAGITVVGAIGVAIFIAPHVSLKPVYFRYSFKSMDVTWWMGLGVRGAMLLAGLAMTFALLALVPRRETWFSDLGTRTLYAYLLHGVVVLIAKDQKWLSLPWLHGPLGVLAITSSALVLAIVLCLPQTRTLFKWLLEPRLVWLYRRSSAASPGKPPPGAPAAAASPGRESSAAVPR
ncbi:acyltransferase family protein [Streptosporangium sp. NBC_01756]|uniref:acyltransferase family protein n=1 Tax=Streptosporangium sp. NBC_01756 TaxID=2975950 RepID=UPI002DDB9D8B|nr:acyltransferase family protein [Streptosporangium sp. NBC_01756]WSC83782.1 hypothetical protein OIE48_25665 [Streptosporangium sp. NBC_01756]